MFPLISGSNQAFLANLSRTEQQMAQSQAQVSSGLRVQQASDDPSAVAEILQLQGDLGQNQQIQANLNTASSQLNTADAALQSAIQVVENAGSLGSQGANSTATADERANLAQQVSGMLQTLVGISNTSVNGVYIFGGDLTTQPSYALDPTQPEGVKQLTTAGATQVVVDINGTSIPISKSAQQLFDARDASGNPASGNVFAAVNALVTALNNNDQTGIAKATLSLQMANQYLNNQLAFYGQAQDSVTQAGTLAQKFMTQEKSTLSHLQDADVATVAIQLSQEQLQNQAALSAESSLLQKRNLFSYLG